MTADELARADAFLEWLGGPNGYTSPIMVGDYWVAVQRLMFHGSLIGGRMHDEASVNWRYCYETTDTAFQAMVRWLSEECRGEPTGWHKRKGRSMEIPRPQIVRAFGRTLDLWSDVRQGQ